MILALVWLALLPLASTADTPINLPLSFSVPFYSTFPGWSEPPFAELFGKLRKSGMCHAARYSACCDNLAETPFIPSPAVGRGQVMPLVWGRANIIGGMTRVSIVPFDQSDNTTAFDLGTVKYGCGESGCMAANEEVDSLDNRSTNCSSTFTLPTYFVNGRYTMQFTRFNTIPSTSVVNAGLHDQTACVDFIIDGPEPVTNKTQAFPEFEGGDVHSGNRSGCLIWNRKRSKGASIGGCTISSNFFDDSCAGKIVVGSPFPFKFVESSSNFDSNATIVASNGTTFVTAVSGGVASMIASWLTIGISVVVMIIV